MRAVLPIACLIVATAAATPEVGRADLAGSWRLVSVTTVRPNGEESTDWSGPKPSGLLMYQPNGYMSVQIRRDPPASWSYKSSADASVDERAKAFDRYYGYYGKYDVDEGKGIVRHYVESSLLPHEVGVTYERRFRLDGDRLYLASTPLPFKGEERYNKLIWERMK